MYRKYIKRTMDILFSLLLIILLSPVYIIIGIVVRCQMGKPILFSQDRIGKDEQIFKLFKFRSMTNARDADGNLLPDRQRLTRFGVALRSTSLDELPELFMILKGDMSFIGPRPQPSFYLPYYKEEERKAHTVRGGLIPPDSQCMNSQCTWEEQLQYEIDYAGNVSFRLDVKIIICTIIILFKRLRDHYGADERPKLSEYRSDWVFTEEEKEQWRKRGAEVKRLLPVPKREGRKWK